MKKSITVMVVGAGRFGRNYVNILSRINSLSIPEIPHVGSLVLSRTNQNTAQAMADETSALPECSVDEIVGIQIENEDHLKKAIKYFAPNLTCITARDTKLGDRIHAIYTLPSLASGAVLCEKPFSSATGDGQSLELIEKLSNQTNARQFGLELPMVVIANELWAAPHLKQQWEHAGTIEFLWEKQNDGGELINDLVIHPWSLIPGDWKAQVLKTEKGIRQCTIKLQVHSRTTSAPSKRCQIHLATGGRFRGLCIDNTVYQLNFEQGRLQLLQHSAPWREVISGQASRHAARIILAVDNPLLMHIKAMLKGKPLVNVERTRQSQLFLEAVNGWS